MSHPHRLSPSRISPVLPLGLLAILAALLFDGCRRSPDTTAAQPPAAATPAAEPAAGPKSSGGLHAVLDTDKGQIVVEFLPAAAPKAVENFRLLSERGYYNGLTFHRIVKGFMLQGGDPMGNGRGGESAWGGMFDDEIQRSSPLYMQGYKRGELAMANQGPNTNGSQFFIMHQDYPLQPNYVIFGKVIRGMDVVDALADTPTTMGSDGGMSRPVTPPVVKKITIQP